MHSWRKKQQICLYGPGIVGSGNAALVFNMPYYKQHVYEQNLNTWILYKGAYEFGYFIAFSACIFSHFFPSLIFLSADILLVISLIFVYCFLFFFSVLSSHSTSCDNMIAAFVMHIKCFLAYFIILMSGTFFEKLHIRKWARPSCTSIWTELLRFFIISFCRSFMSIFFCSPTKSA